MATTDHDAGFDGPVAPLRPARGRLTLVFVTVVAGGLLLGQALRPPIDDETLSGAAPEVVIDTFQGTEWRLSDHLIEDGRPLVLNLWASWCIPCREEIPVLSAFADANPDVAVVGAAVNDQIGDARALADDLQPTYLVGMDATGRLRDRYPSVGMPFTVVIDRAGFIVWSKTGGVSPEDLRDAMAAVG